MSWVSVDATNMHSTMDSLNSSVEFPAIGDLSDVFSIHLDITGTNCDKYPGKAINLSLFPDAMLNAYISLI